MLGILIIFVQPQPSSKETPENILTKISRSEAFAKKHCIQNYFKENNLRRNPAARRCCHYVFYPGKSPPIKQRSSSLNVKTNQACNASSWFECRASPSSPRLALPRLAQPCLALPRPAWGQTSIDPEQVYPGSLRAVILIQLDRICLARALPENQQSRKSKCGISGPGNPISR